MPDIDSVLARLVQRVQLQPMIRAVGLSGGDRPYPQPGEADLDIFIYCTQIPDPAARRQLLVALGAGVDGIELGRISGGHWGVGDQAFIHGVETWLLYFTLEETQTDLESILAGEFLGREGEEYYPIGRLAMWKTLRALYDPDGVLLGLRTRLEEYPPELANAVLLHHLEYLEDVENLERAVRRQDVFFYHFAFEQTLDHFLQALFALNKTFFPSRKRSEAYMRQFQLKPHACEQRLRQALAWGASPSTLQNSYRLWQELVLEMKELTKKT